MSSRNFDRPPGGYPEPRKSLEKAKRRFRKMRIRVKTKKKIVKYPRSKDPGIIRNNFTQS